MARWALGVEYDGSPFCGWQRQASPALPSIQAELEAALGRIADAPVRAICAGRTDAGVHATAQVVHFDVVSERPERAWVRGATTLTHPAVAVRWARRVDDGFHARFSARWRRYHYLMLDRPSPPTLAREGFAHLPGPLDSERMDAASRHLLGERDFEAFRAAGCQSPHAVREIQAISVHRMGSLVVLAVTANAFVLHMVRNIAGTLVAVGRGERPPEWVAEVLASRDRTRAGVAAPPAGLYLTGVGYPDAFALPPAPADAPLPHLALPGGAGDALRDGAPGGPAGAGGGDVLVD